MKRLVKLSSLSVFVIVALASVSCTSRSEKIRLKMEKAMYMNYEGQYEEAIKELSDVIQLSPNNVEAWFRRGNVWFNLRDTDKALADLNQAIALDPGFADAWFNRGNVWFFLNDQEQACADWLESQKLGKPNVGDKTRFCN